MSCKASSVKDSNWRLTRKSTNSCLYRYTKVFAIFETDAPIPDIQTTKYATVKRVAMNPFWPQMIKMSLFDPTNRSRVFLDTSINL